MPASGSWPAAVHRFTAEAAAALRAAEATNRPLLIRGLPGVGKSMTARAAAFEARRPLLSQVIDGRTEADDLKVRFDAVARLADAQVVAAERRMLPAEDSYLSPQVLWWAFDWNGALGQQASVDERRRDKSKGVVAANRPLAPVEVPDGWDPRAQRVVLLLDEIDKADPDLPNALLEALGSNGFSIPRTGQVVACPPQRRPLIVMTTNEERELPAAVLRRCLVLRLRLPDERAKLIKELVAIGDDHQAWLTSDAVALRKGQCLVMREAAAAIADARLAADEGAYRPGTSEFLDLVAALAEMWPDDRRAQRRELGRIEGFVLDKSAGAAE